MRHPAIVSEFYNTTCVVDTSGSSSSRSVTLSPTNERLDLAIRRRHIDHYSHNDEHDGWLRLHDAPWKHFAGDVRPVQDRCIDRIADGFLSNVRQRFVAIGGDCIQERPYGHSSAVQRHPCRQHVWRDLWRQYAHDVCSLLRESFNWDVVRSADESNSPPITGY